MKRRVLSMILTIVMVCSLLPATAYAATTISTVAITGVDVPVAGAKPDYTAITGIGYNPTNKFDEAGKKVSGVSWYNVTDGDTLMSTNDTFIKGKEYKVAIALQVADGYEFSADDNYTPKTSATVNGNSAGKGILISGYSAKNIITVNYTFGKCDYARIDEVAVTGMDVPVVGETPDKEVQVDDDAKYSVDEVLWYDVTEGETMLTGAAVFEANRQYKVQVMLEVEDEDIYRFKTDTGDEEGSPEVTGKINGLDAMTVSTQGDTVVTIEYEFSCNGAEIATISVGGIDEPIEGAFPDFTPSYGAGGYTYYEGYENGIEWIEDDDQTMEAGVDKFRGGHKYKVYVRIVAKEGYSFNVDSGTLNGENVSVSYTTVNGTRIALLIKEFTCIGNISSVDLTIPQPVDGNAPYTTQIVEEKYCSLGTNGTTFKNGFKWHDDNADQYMDLTGTSTFKEGNKYTVTITLNKNEGFKFLESTTAKVNGKSAKCTYASSSNITVQYTFTASHKCNSVLVEKVDATCTTDGKQAYYHCEKCSKNYEDEAGTKEIADITTWGIIKATGHTIEIQNKKDATETEAGYTGDEYCTVCKQVITKGSEIPKVEPTTPEPATKGTTLTDKETNEKYVVTKSDVTNGTVAFSKPQNKKVKSVKIPDAVTIDGVTYKVTSIQKNAFSGCTKLTSATIGKNVTTIGDKAFYNCKSLKSITIPATVNKIGTSAFEGCKKLKTIKIKTTKLTSKKVGNKAFKGTPANAKVTVPKKSLKSYKKFLYKKGLNKKAKIKK
ncbi:MAG: leucine-rich repeat domain-containing protein [Lachnospiraceae bacterium]|nr:leucine-rich repeat domain-containing protein [Lachnospiraceae bacterium]